MLRAHKDVVQAARGQGRRPRGSQPRRRGSSIRLCSPASGQGVRHQGGQAKARGGQARRAGASIRLTGPASEQGYRSGGSRAKRAGYSIRLRGTARGQGRRPRSPQAKLLGAPIRLPGSGKFIKEAVNRNVLALQYACQDLRGNKKVVLKAVKRHGRALEYASPDMQADMDVVIAAVKQDGWALQYASQDLREDKDVVLAAVTQDAWALPYASSLLQESQEVIEAVKQDGSALRHASPALRGDNTVSASPHPPPQAPSPPGMVVVGVLGSLKYHPMVHSWAVDLGTWLSSVEISMDDTVSFKPGHLGEAIHDINQALKSHGVEYTVPDITKGEHLDTRTLLWDILDRVEKKDPSLGTFLLIGAAAYFLEMAAFTTSPETVLGFRNRARKRIQTIWRRNGGVKVNPAALYELLAEHPPGDLELRRKLQRASQPLVILFLAGGPSGTLDVSCERNTLGAMVQTAVIRNAFRVEDVLGCRISDISDALRRYQPTLLHFSGHGTKKGEFCFHGKGGEVEKVKAEALANVLALSHKQGLKGAIMNACYADIDAQLLANATGYAVAMQGLLSDPDANTFTGEFYSALGSGEGFVDAFEWAKVVAAAGTHPLRPKPFQKQVGRIVPVTSSPTKRKDQEGQPDDSRGQGKRQKQQQKEKGGRGKGYDGKPKEYGEEKEKRIIRRRRSERG